MLWILLTIVHVLVCLFLIAVVLLQSGKAADLAGAFGGMGSQTAFGPRGAATALSRATTVAAALFMVTSISLSLVATRSEGGAATVLDSTGATKKTAEPAKPSDPKGQSSTPVQIPGQPAPGTIDPKNAQAPTVELPGGRKVQLPGPGQPGGLVIPEGTPQAEIERRVKAEMERLKRLQEEAEKKAAATGGAVAPAAPPKPDAPKK